MFVAGWQEVEVNILAGLAYRAASYVCHHHRTNHNVTNDACSEWSHSEIIAAPRA
jgi:hypothetical protein